MSKDPAIMFYTSDFLTGTLFMTNNQVGIYIRLLCAQHQHGGIIDKFSFNSLVGENQIVREKFIETDDGFFNERMMEEIEKRSNKSNNLSKNASVRWEKHKQLQSKSNAIAQEPTECDELYKQVIDYFNQVGKFSFKISSAKNKKVIVARIRDNYTFDQFKTVIDFKILNWSNDNVMRQYLRPETLFGSKFESYLQAANHTIPTKINSPMNNTASAYKEAEQILNLNNDTVN